MFVLLTQECFITLGVHRLRSILSSKARKKVWRAMEKMNYSLPDMLNELFACILQ